MSTPDGRFLSRDECTALARRIAQLAVGGGATQTMIDSVWTGAVRWARNRIRVAEDTLNNYLSVIRNIRGADPVPRVQFNQVDAAALEAAVRRAERLLRFWRETQASAQDVEYTDQHLTPTIWSDVTYGLDAETRAEVSRTLIQRAERAGMVTAGDLEMSAYGRAVMSSRGRAMYYPYTEARYSVTVRDPRGQGSGWAGVSHYDWAKIDAEVLTQQALEKCLASRNPVALEPGRYTTILEPQAVRDLGNGFFIHPGAISRAPNETEDPGGVFWKGPYQSKLGDVVVDERLSIRMDPMDPDMSFVPFQYRYNGNQLDVFHPADWIKDGVLMNLAYDRDYAVQRLGKNSGLPTLGAYKMQGKGSPTSMDEMIATTVRGLLVTRFQMVHYGVGYTRDGLWLIEKGKISHPVKNFKFQEDFFNLLQPARLEQIGAPVRTFSPGVPILVPPLKVKDFNFTQLVDAI